MVNTITLRINLRNAQKQRDSANAEIDNITSSIAQLKRQNAWWEQNVVSKYTVQNGRYIDPYNQRDVTKSIEDERKKFSDMITDLENKKADKEREVARAAVLIYTLMKDIQQAKADNATEIKDLAKKGKASLKKVPGQVLDKIKRIFRLGVTATKTTIADYQSDKQNEVKFSDKVIDQFLHKGRTVAHSRNVTQQGSSLNQDQSQLSSIQFFNDKGNPTVSYDHYDKFSNSIDLDLDKEYRFGKFDPQHGLVMETFKSVTIVLTEDHKIDFSLPENQSLLAHKEIVGEILSKYPEAFESIPLDVIEKDPKFFTSKFTDGINYNVSRKNFGVDKDGNLLDETSYLNQMTEVGQNKRQAFLNRAQARQNFSDEMNEDYEDNN